jgi:N4-gp56 family major capsid protein
MAVTAYGSITPTQAAYSAKVLLERAVPYLVLEQIGQLKPLPANNTKTINFRRHKLAAVASQIGANGEVLTAGNLSAFQLAEGTTPTELGTTMQNVDVTLTQYGAVIGITDVIEETHVDDVLTEYMGLLGENAGQVVEAMRWLGIVGDAGVNVILSQDTAGVSAASEGAIKIPAGPAEFRAAVRSIRNNHGRPITKVVKSDVRFGTQACEPSFIAVCHSDMEGTLRKTLGANFTPVADYGSSMTPLQGEFGNFENVRFLTSTLLGKRANAGATVGTAANLHSDNATNVNLYDILVFASDAWAGVALKGEYAVTPTLVRATPSESDPLAQRSKAGYKTMQAVKVLQTAHIKKIVSGAYKDSLLS